MKNTRRREKQTNTKCEGTQLEVINWGKKGDTYTKKVKIEQLVGKDKMYYSYVRTFTMFSFF